MSNKSAAPPATETNNTNATANNTSANNNNVNLKDDLGKDALDDEEFDVIDYINKRFPNEQSMSTLDHFTTRVKAKVKIVEKDISDNVLQQSTTSNRGKTELTESKLAISELFSKIRDIKRKAVDSEQMVDKITRDIKSLDYAKKNMTATITALKRLHMLVTGVEQLKAMAEKQKYKETANLLDAVNQLCTTFESFSQVAKIRELLESVKDVKGDLRRQVMRDFSNFDENAADGVLQTDKERLAEACGVVDGLGTAVVNEVIEWFIKDKLKDYRQQFAVFTLANSGSEANNYEFIDRRYSWLRKWLKTYDAVFAGIFPDSWQVCEQYCERWCKTTKTDIQDIFKAKGEGIDVTVMLKVLQKTLDVENELTIKVKTIDERRIKHQQQLSAGMVDVDVDSEEEIDETLPEDIDPSSVEGIKWKYRMHDKKQKREERRAARKKRMQEKMEELERLKAQSPDSQDKASLITVGASVVLLADGGSGRKAAATTSGAGAADKRVLKQFSFKNILSSAFEPYMSLYIKQEDKQQQEMIDGFAQQSDWYSEGTKVLPSGTDLFIYFKKSMKRCLQLGKGQVFFELYKVFKKTLKSYADVLNNKLPKVPEAMPAVGAKANEWAVRLDSRDQCVVCLIISTCDYYAKTITELQESIKRHIDDPHKEQINLEDEVDMYQNVISKSLMALVLAVETKLDPCFTEMVKMPWALMETVGDQSGYVGQMTHILQAAVVVMREHLPAMHFRFFCDKMAASFIPRFIFNIYRCKGITETGAQQLQIDCHGLKSVLLELPILVLSSNNNSNNPNSPNLTSNDDPSLALAATTSAASSPSTQPDAVPPGFIKFINREMTKAENLIKVILSPPQSLLENYNTFIPDGSTADFTKIMDVKGLKTNEQQGYLERLAIGQQNMKSLLANMGGGVVGVGVGGGGGGGRGNGLTNTAAATETTGKNNNNTATTTTAMMMNRFWNKNNKE